MADTTQSPEVTRAAPYEGDVSWPEAFVLVVFFICMAYVTKKLVGD